MSLSGKIGSSGFENIILSHCGHQRKEVTAGPAFGVDVSVIDLSNGLGMALTSDPLSLIPSLGLQESAWLSVHLMANDMATTGFAPMYAQMVLNLPAELSEADFKTYWHFIHQHCKEIGVAITGGHTGRIEGQHSTIAGGGTMVLTAPKDKIRLSKNAKAGNSIIVTKEYALSSSAILAMSFPETVKNNLGMEVYNKGCELFYQTSSLKDGIRAAESDHVTAMHDVTEGGILGAIYEMAVASGNGVRIYNDQIPAGEIQKQICGLFRIDPRYCIGAGSMVVACEKEHAHEVVEHLHNSNIKATIVGELTEKEAGYKIIDSNIEKPLVYHSRDPYWEAFFNAYKNKWK